jgi:hypothetical protein
MITLANTVLAAMLVFAATAASAQSPAPVQQKERVVPRRPGVPIRSVILPSDKILIVAMNVDGGLIPMDARSSTTSRESAVNELVKVSDAVVLATVVGRQSLLTKHEDWIESTYYLKIDRVFESKVPIDAAGMFHVFQSGGELMLGDCLVRTMPPGEHAYTIGQRYLIPLRKVDTVLDLYSTAYHVDGDRLIDISMRASGTSVSPLDGAPVSEVFALIGKRAKAASGKH